MRILVSLSAQKQGTVAVLVDYNVCLDEISSGQFVIYDPEELVVTFHLVTSEIYFPPETVRPLDLLRIDLSSSTRIEAVHPDLIRDPATRKQRYPLDYIGCILAEVELGMKFLSPSMIGEQRIADEEAGTFGIESSYSPSAIAPSKLDASTQKNEKVDCIPFTTAKVSIHLDALELKKPTQIDVDTSYNYLRDADRVTEEILDNALETVYEVLERWAWASHKLIRNVSPPATAHRFQLEIPYSIRQAGSPSKVRAGTVINGQYVRTLNEKLSKRTTNSIDDLDFADQRMVLDRYISLTQEARYSEVVGLYSGAISLAANACEYLAICVQNMLDWEDEVAPENSTYQSDPRKGIQSRVAAVFAPRLGGNWDLSRPGPLREWSSNVANIRNAIVHSGYQPTAKEARAAIESISTFLKFFVDRIASEKGRSRYPRSAVMLAGNASLEARGARTSRIRSLQSDSTQHDWQDSFLYWVAQSESAVSVGTWNQSPRRIRDYACIIRSADKSIAFVEANFSEGWARQVSPDAQWPPVSVADNIRSILDNLSANSEPYIIVALTETADPDDQLLGEQKLMYHLLPNRSVSPDKSQRLDLEFASVDDV